MRDSVEQQVENVLARSGLGRDLRAVVGVSGGTDSLVLLHVLAGMARRGRGPAVTAVHVDHGLRAGSAGEGRVVLAEAEGLGVRATAVAVDVGLWSERVGGGVEAAARAARYAALATVARDEGTDWVLVGHNRDDQAETVLLHLARGAGLDGAAGMRELSRRPVALDPDDRWGMPIRLLRPLLQVPRADLSAYALAHGLSPIEDPSNRSTVFRRNAVRHGVIPSLEQATGGGSAALARSAALLRDDADLLAVLAEEAAADVLVDDRGLVLVARAALRRLHVSLQRRVLRLALTRVGLAQPPAFERLEALREAAVAGKVSARLDLGCGFAARVDYREVALAPVASLDALLRRASAWPLLAPGTVIAVTGPLDLGLGNGWRLGLRPDGEASSVWTLRTRQPADRLVAPDGSAVRLQDWLVNRKVPEYLRDWLPLLARDGTVRWVGGAGGGKQRVHEGLCVFLRRDDPGGA